MQKYKHKLSAFTLVELIVSITIFWMMMISIISVFIFSSQMSTRVELNRNVQENLKNSLEDIAEEIRKGDVFGFWDIWAIWNCQEISQNHSTSTWTKLCLNNWEISYFIGHSDGLGSFVREDTLSDCRDVDDSEGKLCRIIKKNGTELYPLTNNLIAIENIEFTIIGSKLPRVQVVLTARTPHQQWIHPELVEASRFSVQTTLSERLIQTE